MDIKIQAKGSTHTVIENGKYAVYDLQTDMTGRFEGGSNRVDIDVKNRTEKYFNPNIVDTKGDIVTIKRVTAGGEAVFLSASSENRLNLFGRSEQLLPQVRIDRLGAPADVFVAGVDEKGIRRYAGQTVLLRDGSHATVTPGNGAVGEVTILLIG